MSQTLGSSAKVRWDDRPAFVSVEMNRLKALAKDMGALADAVVEAFEELYEASLSPNGSGESRANRRGLPLSDPTGEVAVSGQKRGMRRHVRRAAVKLRKIEPILLEVQYEIDQGLNEAFDPDMREKLRRMRELERAIEAGE